MAQIKGGGVFASLVRGISDGMTKSSVVDIGFLENATYPDGTQVALVAAVQEFGSSSRGIPPRPFFRNMIAAKKGEWPEAAKHLLVGNNYDSTSTLQQLGEGIKGQLQTSITETNAPPLKPSTIAHKGFDKPLIDTGQMINSVDYRVRSIDLKSAGSGSSEKYLSDEDASRLFGV